MIGFLFNAALCAANVAAYAISGHWYNLAVGVFCGLVSLMCLAMETS